MNVDGIRMILEALDCKRIGVRAGKWVRCSCPFSYRHPKQQDRHPSFAVRINPDKPSGWFCYTCQERGWLGLLVKEVEKATGYHYPKDLHEFAKKDGDVSPERIKDKLNTATFWNPSTLVGGVRMSVRRQNALDPDYKPPYFPESTLDNYKGHSLDSMLYLQGDQRKLTQKTIDEWEIGWDEEDRRIMLPIRNNDGRLVAYSGRLFESPGEVRLNHKGKRAPKYLHSKGFKRDYLLYGEHLRKSYLRTGYVMEGFFDVVYLWQLGYRNVFAIMGTYLSEIQQKKIKRWCEHVIVITDGDEPGREMGKTVSEALRPDVVAVEAHCPEGLDVNDLTPEELRVLIGPPNGPSS